MPEAPHTDFFSASYDEARERFLSAVGKMGWNVTAHPIAATSPGGGSLTIDVATSDEACARRLLVTSGVHGVEGFFGSAVQLALIEAVGRGEIRVPSGCGLVLVHAVNPHGFAWSRRTDEGNVDLNRNFLLAGQSFDGASAGYAEIDELINPASPPAGWDGFKLRLVIKMLRMGMRRLRSAIATGQYLYPKGVFYGGDRPSEISGIVARQLPVWIPEGTQAALHLDFHSGLGRWADYVLLSNDPEDVLRLNPLAAHFDRAHISSLATSNVAYPVRGVMTEWIASHQKGRQFLTLGVEFGTYSPIHVLEALRRENRAHFHSDPVGTECLFAKSRLREAFCPDDPGWRERVVAHSLEIFRASLQGLGDP